MPNGTPSVRGADAASGRTERPPKQYGQTHTQLTNSLLAKLGCNARQATGLATSACYNVSGARSHSVRVHVDTGPPANASTMAMLPHVPVNSNAAAAL